MGTPKVTVFLIVSLIAWATPTLGQDSKPGHLLEGEGYVVEQPGTITFRQGVKIVGKVEKPQVMIFLPKEKSYHREITFDHSFKKDITEPLAFDPITK